MNVVVIVVVVVVVVHVVGERSKRLEEIRLRRQQQREALLQGASLHTASERASQVSTGTVLYYAQYVGQRVYTWGTVLGCSVQGALCWVELYRICTWV